jgi:2-polyprenyl-3-methyl-5-hydroxy-6-metoxy-1,4-benzoquinol methylase
MSASRYAREIGLEQTNDAHSLGILSVPRGSSVLDVGAAAGDVARVLRERGCAVIGIEIDPRAAAAGEQHVDRMIVGDIEHMDLDAELGTQRFDVVLLLDVLEHLREPGRVLGELALRLAPGGRVIASIPNITHAAVRLELLQGRFRYRTTGLLDETHVHFFDSEEVEVLFRRAGLAIDERLRVTRNLDETEFDVDVAALPADVLAAATSGDDALTYQFVVTARNESDRPVITRADGETFTLAERLQHELEEQRAAYEAAAAYVRQLDGAGAQAAELEARLIELQAVLAERMDEYRESAEAVHQLEVDIAVKDAYIADLRVRAERGRELDEVWGILREHQEREQGHIELINHLNAVIAEHDRFKYRVADRIDDSLKRVPFVHSGLKRVAGRG